MYDKNIGVFKIQKGLTSLNDMLIGDRVFEVPVYQRNYSWEEKQCEDLWNDLLYLKNGKKHYFGTILIKKSNKSKEHGLKDFEVFELIDGQQRMATIIMLLREIITQIASLKDTELNEGISKLEEEYLKYSSIYKLDLMGEDKDFYRDYIINDLEFPSEILTPSRKRLKEAKIFFRGKFEQQQKELDNPLKYKKFLMDLKRKIDYMDVIRYEVENDSDAVLIFETVNDRGKLLTNLEKTKSFLMHSVYLSENEDTEENLIKINKSFSDIFRWFEIIKSTEKGKNLREDDIQRYHFIIYEELTKRREASYKYIDFIKTRIKDLYREDENKSLIYALEYTEELKSAFLALKEIITYDNDDNLNILFNRIFALERVANFYPLLIAVWIKYKNNIFSKREVEKILKIIEIASFRIYAIGKRKSNAGQSLVYTLAYDIHKLNLEFQSLEESLIKNLIEAYENDKSFKNNLNLENFYNRVAKPDIKYLLFEYGNSIIEESLQINLGNILKPKFQVEHIWPQNPSKLDWTSEETRIHEEYKDKLGNLTIAHKKWNESWGNRPFNDKKQEYEKSGLKIQSCLSKFDDWRTNEIDGRQSRIVEFAMNRWKIPK